AGGVEGILFDGVGVDDAGDEGAALIAGGHGEIFGREGGVEALESAGDDADADFAVIVAEHVGAVAALGDSLVDEEVVVHLGGDLGDVDRAGGAALGEVFAGGV